MAGSGSYRILVIDDEQVVLDASARLLKAEGYDVLTALNAEEGLELARSGAPDLAIVDLKLPGMSGLDFVDSVVSSGSELRVILTTGVSSADQAVAALSHGAFDFLPKPFTYEELMSPILRACRDIEFIREGATGRGAPDDSELLFLGRQAWARPDPHGTTRLGASHVFQRNAGKVLEVVSPKINAELRQGGALARVRTDDQRWHVVLAAVGGRVTTVNERLAADPGLINDDPWSQGWIAEVHSPELHHDLVNLSR